MADAGGLLAAARDCFRSGQLAQGEQHVRAALLTAPDSADAWFLLGAACQGQGRAAEAAEYYNRALSLWPQFPEAYSNLANALRSLGRLAEAENCCRQALRLRPDYPEAHNNLGNTLRDLGQPGPAVDCYAAALRLYPDVPEILLNMGNALRDLGRSAEAAGYFRRVLERRPDFVEAHYHLGNALQDQGQWADAAESFRGALRLRPDYPEALLNLGNILQSRGQLDEAVACFRRAVAARPNYPEAHYNLANALREVGLLGEAEAHYRQALALRPTFPEAWLNLGTAVRDLGRPNDAVPYFQRALEQRPGYAEAHNNLGAALRDLGRSPEALTCYAQALRLQPNYADAHSNLGVALRDRGRIGEAEESLRRALALQPNSAEAHNNLGIVLRDQCRLDEAEASFRRALEGRPRVAIAGLLMTLHYQAGQTPETLAAAHADFDRRHAEPLRTTWRPPANDRDPDRPLRLGLVSPDFGWHPVGFLLVRAIEALTRRPGAIVCYSNRLPVIDALTPRFRAAATGWHDTAGLSDEDLADLIRADRIDVLIDLAGHTAGNRLLTFARKPAPVQMTWLGYEGTTGLAAMDYLIADDRLIPPGAEVHYRERVLRLPGGYTTYDPPAGAPDPGPPPAVASGRVTFGCFNNPTKLSPPALALFAAALNRAPGARLLLQYRGLDDSSLAARLRQRLSAAGVEPDRVELRGGLPHAEYLAAYRDVDIALDPIPFNGGVTTCDALWMGVPVVTLPGATFASRHGLSYLYSIGLTDELVARDVEDFAARAAALAHDPDRLTALRSGLRERMARSPFCDGERLADELGQALRGAWREWVAGA
jgi:predicted O-linked N-acetylglucosamine transferase (SPINDLY family)